MKIGIGTAQFGMDYGITNTRGLPNQKEIQSIFELAKKNNIKLFDTAASYGNSEETIGNFLDEKYDFQIVTKTIIFNKPKISLEDKQILIERFKRSLALLKSSKVYGLLLHNTNDLKSPGGERLLDALFELKDLGLTDKIGVSVYHPHEIDFVLSKGQVDIIQLPVSVFDQRFIKSGHLDYLKLNNVEVHARSVFLQGLLLEISKAITMFEPFCEDQINDYILFLKETGLSPLKAALGFVLGLDGINRVLCGIESCAQLEEICNETMELNPLSFEASSIDDERVILPINWNLK